jgi:PAS domain S-box-containing protein
MVGVLYMENFPERAFANKRMLVMNLLVQQLGISITNALLYQSVLQSETKLNGLLENMPCGIALWDATAENCQYINSSWRDMTGYSLEEIMDSGWKILMHKDEAAIYGQHWRDRVQAGEPCQWENRYGLKDGSYRWAIVRMLPIKSPSEDKVIQWLTVTIDIDDQRRAVQLKSNFLANMSHELRTYVQVVLIRLRHGSRLIVVLAQIFLCRLPDFFFFISFFFMYLYSPFSGILGMLSLLRDSSGLSHEQFEFVDMAKGSCEMLIRIVDDLLNFSKLEADKVTLEYIPLCFEEILGGMFIAYNFLPLDRIHCVWNNLPDTHRICHVNGKNSGDPE